MLDEYGPMRGIHRADTVIVGGGLTGLMTGAALADAGLLVIVLDAQQPGSGAGSRSVTVMAAPVYERIARQHDWETARLYLKRLQETMAELSCQQQGICREADAYTYAFLPRDLPALDRQLTLYEKLRLPVMIAQDAGGCPFPVELSLMLPGQQLLEPERLVAALASRIIRRGGMVCANSRVLDFHNGHVYTLKGRADAPVVILAAGIPPGTRSRRLLSLLENRRMLHCRLTGGFPLHSCQQSVREDGLRLSPGPGGITATWCAGRTGTQSAEARTTLFQRVLQGRLKDWQPGEVSFYQEIRSLDGLPVIGRLPDMGMQVLCATGYSGHGILGAQLAAGVLSRQVLGRERFDDRLYAPDRALPRRTQLYALGRMQGIFARNSLRRRAPVCPHMGCRLRYSVEARRWECPFCGSVFSMFGQVRSGPALRGKRISALKRPDL